MESQQPPAMQDEHMPEPRPLRPVDFPDEPGPPVAGVLTFAGTYVNPDAEHFGPQSWSVRVSARSEDRAELERFREGLLIWLDAEPDTDELDAVMAALDEPAAKTGDDLPVARLLAEAAREPDVRSVVVLQTELVSHSGTVNWGEIRDNLNQGARRIWTGRDRKWAKLRVEGGSADLRGVTGWSPIIVAVNASNWEVADEQCSVVGMSAGLATYRMSAGWKPKQ